MKVAAPRSALSETVGLSWRAQRGKRSDETGMDAPVGSADLALSVLVDHLAEALAPRLAQLVATELAKLQQPQSGAGRLFTVDEVADVLAVSRTTLYRLIRNGRMRSVVVAGGSRRISSEAIEEYCSGLSSSPSSLAVLPEPTGRTAA